MRDCPTVEGSSIPLIIHRIGVGDCLQRQACNYHKCHRCVFRGKPVAWVPSENGASGERHVATGERAVPSRTVNVPRPERRRRKPLGEPAKPGAKSEAKSDAKAPAARKERPRPAPSPS